MNLESAANTLEEVYMAEVEIKGSTDLVAEQSQDVKEHLVPRFIP